MINGRRLSGTLTITEFNDTDSYIIYEFDAEGTSFSGNILSITPTAVYASPLVDTSNSPVNSVCLQFDLFRGVKTFSQAGVVSSNTTFYSVNQSDYDGMVIDYVVKKTDATTGARTGTVLSAWDGTSTTVEFTDTSTRDAGGSTAGLSFRVTSTGGVASLGFTITSGTYTITINVRPLGEYM
jgi:hypothetical protein